MTIAFTPGEPAGAGIDLAVGYAQTKAAKDLLVFSDPDLLRERAKILRLPLEIIENTHAEKSGQLCVYPVFLPKKATPGRLEKDNAPFVLEAVDRAVQSCFDGQSAAILTGPIHKGIINEAGIAFSGHTGYLAKLGGVDKVVMMLVTEGLRVALVTIHLPLSEVSKNINEAMLERTLDIVHSALENQFGITHPRMSVLGLNPHAGEDGHLGREEIEIINPTIDRMIAKGFNLSHCIPADTAFTPDNLAGVDCVVAMYHDQGLPVLKTLGFEKSANTTLGLPFIRTSVAHGVALSLAGSGKIKTGSFEYALALTRTLSGQRSHAA